MQQQKSLPKVANDEVFIVDKKGDEKNLVYGSTHRYSVPQFYRAGAGSVLGLPSFVKIDRNYNDEKRIVLHDKRDINLGQREKYVFSKIERERPRLLKIRTNLTVHDSTAEVDYLPLQVPRGRKRKRDSGESSSSEDGDMSYRSIYGKAKPKDEPDDDHFQYATESDGSQSESGRNIGLDTTVRQKMIELSRKVEESPHNITAWLALIDYQDKLIRAEDQRRVTIAELRSTADIKIHMYEQALEKVRSLKDREKLLLGLMAEGEKIWELRVQSERWKQISRENISSLVLWKSYLNFRQTDFGNFQYEEIREIYIQRIKMLLQAAPSCFNRSPTLAHWDIHAVPPKQETAGVFKTVDKNPSNAINNQIVYTLLRLTIFMRESGYAELAVAIWQGLLEFNYLAPPKSLKPLEKIGLFKDFWESEIPRIGEDRALGWRHFVANEGASEAPDIVNDEEGNILNDDIFGSWAAAERARARVSCTPARTMDEVVEDDPFRVILASDIEEFLVDFPAEMHASLLDAFLLFSGLPSITTASRGWSNDPFIGEGLVECNPAWIERQHSLENCDGNEERQVHVSSIFKIPLSNFQNSPESMFGLAWFKYIRNGRDVDAGDNGPLQYKFLRNTFKQLLQVHFREDLAEYYLALEWRYEPQNIKKVSKSLLKHHSSSLRLYNAYAMIEWSKGDIAVANGIYSAALEMVKSLPENERDGSVILWKSWVWAYLGAQDKASALSRILSIESGTPSDQIGRAPFQILKTRQHLASRRDHHLYSGSMLLAILYAECLALLQYLTSDPCIREPQCSIQGNITAALEVFNCFSGTLQQTLKDRNDSDTSYHELFLQSAARLLYQ
jgi:hypothetical protein